MKKCPYCAEEIQDDAIKCRFCGEMLSKETLRDADTVKTVKDYHRSKGKNYIGVGMLLMILSIGGCLVGAGNATEFHFQLGFYVFLLGFILCIIGRFYE